MSVESACFPAKRMFLGGRGQQAVGLTDTAGHSGPAVQGSCGIRALLTGTSPLPVRDCTKRMAERAEERRSSSNHLQKKNHNRCKAYIYTWNILKLM